MISLIVVWNVVHPAFSFWVHAIDERINILNVLFAIEDVDQGPGGDLVIDFEPNIESFSKMPGAWSEIAFASEPSLYADLVQKKVVRNGVWVVTLREDFDVLVFDDFWLRVNEPGHFDVVSLFVSEFERDDVLDVVMFVDFGVLEFVESSLWRDAFVDEQAPCSEEDGDGLSVDFVGIDLNDGVWDGHEECCFE